ncbi:LOW QUALITY PROTEIN: signal transducer and activator of transcription 1-alpha/beta [Sinocyclocheilus anshuiensis]|uniref:LOW QUALITY PROTEIN: signal transducer and activator of transcription 1-alpha/beta n=1 Tax=Sinocyclocheilus anshuiensis TaxID=1608454 RepID=UPI003D695A5C
MEQEKELDHKVNILKWNVQYRQQVRQQLKKIRELVQKFTYNNDPLTLGKSQLDEQALSLFKTLILNSLVVERQPCILWHPRRPLVLKMGVQFSVKIRSHVFLWWCWSVVYLGYLVKFFSFFKFSSHEAQGDREELIHWNTLFKTSTESGDSLWQWIYEHLELTEKHVLNIWNDGYIMGFLSKERERALLRDKLPGTFLLRFSENSRCGGLIITWVERSQDDEPVVHSTEPYSKVDLNRISLPNIIHDYTVTDGEKDPVNPLIYLYPDIPRDVAFGRYYTTASDVKDFYIHIYALHICNVPLLTIALPLDLHRKENKIRV